jgi:drug/metabolite transporter (DMT)-like permease
MLLATVLCHALVKALRMKIPHDAAARRGYLGSAIAIYGSMMSIYWGAQFIPSGLIAVLYGTTPLVTGVVAGLWLNERGFTPAKTVGMFVGLAGLAVIFNDGMRLGPASAYGIAAVLFSVCLQTVSAVLIKRSGTRAPALATATGGLTLALPLYLATWLWFDGHLPVHLPLRAGVTIVYLALFGSVLGFAMYYYMLKHLDAARIALVTLITPVTALLIGHVINGERLGWTLWAGTALILSGLLAHQWDALLARIRRRRDARAGEDNVIALAIDDAEG